MSDDISEQQSIRIGLLGELELELQLVQKGWHPVRLDTAQMASNADLLAVNRKQRVSIQVKTTDAGKKHSHADWLGFGYSTAYLRDKKPVFNSKVSPLIADVIVGVSYKAAATRFIILPVALAEALCRMHCDYWFSVPTGTSTGKRSHSFPIYLCLTKARADHTDLDERIKRNLLKYENAWSILSEPVEKLHNPKAWRIR